jgi:glycosyltransferase involved in cell wall biosynthesis
MRIAVVVPAYNEAKTVAGVVRSLCGPDRRVIVVDDGSGDGTGAAAEEMGAEVVRHVINRGLGASLATGIACALEGDCDCVVTFDADGQHRVEDLPGLTAPILEGRADIAIGARVADRHLMPITRRLANSLGNLLTWALFGVWVSDSQSGLRAFSRRAASEMELRSDRMEVSSEIIREIGRNEWRVAEVPIVPVYTDYSLSKGQGFLVGLKTAMRLIVRRLVD